MGYQATRRSSETKTKSTKVSNEFHSAFSLTETFFSPSGFKALYGFEMLGEDDRASKFKDTLGMFIST